MCLPPVRDRWEESCHSAEGMCCVPWREDGCLSLQSTRRRNEKHHSDPLPQGNGSVSERLWPSRSPKGGTETHTPGTAVCAKAETGCGCCAQLFRARTICTDHEVECLPPLRVCHAVCWNSGKRHEVWRILRKCRPASARTVRGGSEQRGQAWASSCQGCTVRGQGIQGPVL